jgi:hypothetical protein
MATVTPNFSWPVPTSTDLVKDGATAIEALGDSIDASLVDLKGGTTGQVLSKTSGTDMDFTWVTSDDANAIQNTIVDAKGDLIAATAADTPARLAVGTNGQVLTADSTAATGLKWAAAAGGAAMTLVSTTTLSGTTTNITGISSSYNTLIMLFANVSNNAGDSMNIRINTDTGSNYTRSKWRNYSGTVTYDASAVTTSFGLTYDAGTSTSGYMQLNKYDSTKYVVSGRSYQANRLDLVDGFYNGSAAATTLSITSSSGSFSGTVYVYGA